MFVFGKVSVLKQLSIEKLKAGCHKKIKHCKKEVKCNREKETKETSKG